MLSGQTISAPTALSTSTDRSCRLCGLRLRRTVVDLGCRPFANRLIAPGGAAAAHPLRLALCDRCLLVQTEQTPTPDHDLHPVLPSSRRSSACIDHARRFAGMMRQRLGLGAASLVVEVGAHDVALLRYFREATVPALALDPGFDAALAATDLGIPVDSSRLNAETAMEIAVRHGRADLAFAGDGLPEVANLFDFVAGLAGILRPKGIVVFEFPHLLSMIQKGQFDTVRHDRFNYLSLLALERVLRPVGLRAFDAEALTDHGGSLRVYACHIRGPHPSRPGLKTVRLAEAGARLDGPEGYEGLQAKVDTAREDVREFLAVRQAAGRSVGAYGAVGRGTTLLNACGISADTVLWAADPDPDLSGLCLPGSHIPVVGLHMLTEHRPDDLLILPWPNAAEIAAGLLPLRQKGTLFWTMTPSIRRV